MDEDRQQRLLSDAGNTRTQAPAVRELLKRPPNTLFDVTNPDPNCLEETLKVSEF